jgi:hypothetical protein
VRLNPKQPPGRVNRKARAFEPEIARLRSEGYTCEAIRAALADVGVDVSLSTVQREAARSKSPPLSTSRQATTADPPAAAAVPTRTPSVVPGDPRTGREIAATFVGKRNTNPLLRDRSSHESSRH